MGSTAIWKGLRVVWGITAFNVGTNLSRWLTRGGLILGLGVMVLGMLLSVQRGLGWTFDRDVGAIGFFLMALFAIRSGLEEHREIEFDAFLRQNLVEPVHYAMGLLAALVVTWGFLCAITFVSVLALGAGDLGLAVWTVVPWGLRVLVLLGFVPLIESAATLRLPLIVPALAYAGLLIALTIVLPEDQAIAYFAPVAPGQVGQALRLGLQGVISITMTGTVFLLWFVLGPSLSRRIRSAAAFNR